MEWFLTGSGRRCQTKPASNRVEQMAQEEMLARRGSKALAVAIFKTGRLHGPMSVERQREAVCWAHDIKLRSFL